MSTPPIADWYADPMHRHQLRYWDGKAWTNHVANNGKTSTDPISGPAATKVKSVDTCREYLERAPEGPRTEVLGSGCVIAIKQLPIASADRFGEFVLRTELVDSVSLVEQVLSQDRSLSSIVAFKHAMMLKVLIEECMPKDSLENTFSAVFAACGVPTEELQAKTPEFLRDRRGADDDMLPCTTIFALIRAKAAGKAAPEDWVSYVHLIENHRVETVRRLALDTIAWSSILQARIWNAGKSVSPINVYMPPFDVVPRMNVAGWYPNPQKLGGFLKGEAKIQRYWDGDWTSRVKHFDGRGWKALEVPLSSTPPDESRNR